MKKGDKARVWTDQEIDYLKNAYDGTRASIKLISKHFGLHIENIRIKIKRLGIYVSTDKRRNWSEKEIDKLRILYQTHSVTEIAIALDRGRRTIENAITKYIDVKNGRSKRRRRKLLDGEQRCSKCGIVKNVLEFEINKRCRNQCKECRYELQRLWREDRIDRMSPDELLAFRKKTSKQAKLSRLKHPETKKISTLKRRERERKLEVRMSKSDIKLVYDKFGNKCFNCSSSQDLCIDHHFPLAKGFGLTMRNAVLLCKTCNTIKNDKMPEDFYSDERIMQLNHDFGILTKEEILIEQPVYDINVNRRKNPPIRYGTENNNSKLDDDKVRLARKLSKEGTSTTQLAKMLGVSLSTMSQAIIGKTWRHIM